MTQSFKPLGYRFEIHSPLGVSAAVSALRQKKVSWVAPKNGARGWIVGNYLCLWWTAFDRHGPMIIAQIEGDDSSCRIVGRAGSDLNGTLAFLLLTPLMVWLVVMMAVNGQGTIGSYLMIGVVFGLGLPLTLWINSKDRRDADPLVRFLKKTTKSDICESTE